MALLNQANAVMVGSVDASRVYCGDIQVWPPAATVAPSRPSGSNATHTSCRLTWAEVSDITEYELKHQSHNYGIIAGTTKDISGLSQNSTYDFQIRTVRRYGSTGIVYSNWSPILRLTTGQPEVRKTGSGSHEIRPTNSGTYRPVDAWAQNGTNVAQGYYSDSNATGYGHWTYDGPAFRQYVADNWGSDVVDNLNFTFWKVALYRNATSSNGGNAIRWYVSASKAHQGLTPNLQGGADSGTIELGTSGWFNAGTSHMHWVQHVLMNDTLSAGTIWSFAHYYPGTAQYMVFLGYDKASNAGNLYCEFNWDFVTKAYVAPAWSNV